MVKRLLLPASLALSLAGCYRPLQPDFEVGLRIVQGDLDPRKLDGPGLVHAFVSFCAVERQITPPARRLATLEKVADCFRGTRFEERLKMMIDLLRLTMASERYRAAEDELYVLDRRERLRRIRAIYKGTPMEKMLDAFEERLRTEHERADTD